MLCHAPADRVERFRGTPKPIMSLNGFTLSWGQRFHRLIQRCIILWLNPAIEWRSFDHVPQVRSFAKWIIFTQRHIQALYRDRLIFGAMWYIHLGSRDQTGMMGTVVNDLITSDDYQVGHRMITRQSVIKT